MMSNIYNALSPDFIRKWGDDAGDRAREICQERKTIKKNSGE